MILLSETIFALAGIPIYELPLYGGSGPMVVTAIGIGLAALSLLFFFLRGKSDDKPNKKTRK